MGAVMHAYSNVTVTEKLTLKRPARVPAVFKIAAVASVAGLRDSRGDAPLDAFVPIRTSTEPPMVIAAEAAAVLGLVDGERALRDVAREGALPLATVIEAYFDLLARGLVAERGPEGRDSELPRLRDSFTEEAQTNVNDVVTELARLSIATSTPTLRGVVEWSELSAHEAWVISLVSAGFNVQAILEVSPLAEEQTLSVLGKLIDARVISMQA